MKHNPKQTAPVVERSFRKITKNGSTYSIALTKYIKGWKMAKVTVLYLDKDMIGMSLEKVDLGDVNNAQTARIQKANQQDA